MYPFRAGHRGTEEFLSAFVMKSLNFLLLRMIEYLPRKIRDEISPYFRGNDSSHLLPREIRHLAQLLLDANQLIVFRHPVRA